MSRAVVTYEETKYLTKKLRKQTVVQEKRKDIDNQEDRDKERLHAQL